MTALRSSLRRSLPVWLTAAAALYLLATAGMFLAPERFPGFGTMFVVFAIYWGLVYSVVRWSQIPEGGIEVDERYRAVVTRATNIALYAFAIGILAITFWRGVHGFIDTQILLWLILVATAWPLMTMAMFRRS